MRFRQNPQYTVLGGGRPHSLVHEQDSVGDIENTENNNSTIERKPRKDAGLCESVQGTA